MSVIQGPSRPAPPMARRNANIEPFREIAIDGALYFDPVHGAEALRAKARELAA